MDKTSLLSLSFVLLVLSHGCLGQQQGQGQQGQGQWGPGQGQGQQGQQQFQGQCQFQQLMALQPSRRVQHEAGVVETWDCTSPELQCAGVSVFRVTVHQNGLQLPTFTSGNQIGYVVQGTGVLGPVKPGCPETYQEPQQFQQGHGQGQQGQGQEGQGGQQGQGQQGQGQEGQTFFDMHQKVYRLRPGDVFALQAGEAHWFYNDGQGPLVIVAVIDLGNNANQLDRIPRAFQLAGSNPQQQQSFNIYHGFDPRILAEAFKVNLQTARQLQNTNDKRGNIVRVQGGLQFIRPPFRVAQGEQQQGSGGQYDNGFEETVCTMRMLEHIDDPLRADIYAPQVGRINTVNRWTLPLLGRVQLSAERGVFHPYGMTLPHWNMNAHSILYVTGGQARVEVVNSNGQQVFNGVLNQGQLLTVPQGFAVVKRAEAQGFEYIAFKTHGNAVVNTLAGRFSAIRAMPLEVVANAFGVSRQQAYHIKFNNPKGHITLASSFQQIADA